MLSTSFCTLYLYNMVTQNMLRTHEGKNILFVTVLVLIKCLKHIKITEIAPYVRTYFWVTIKYKYHGSA